MRTMMSFSTPWLNITWIRGRDAGGKIKMVVEEFVLQILTAIVTAKASNLRAHRLPWAETLDFNQATNSLVGTNGSRWQRHGPLNTQHDFLLTKLILITIM